MTTNFLLATLMMFVVFPLLEWRINRRTARWEQRYYHRLRLAQAQAAGEGSLEFHAMQCTVCGGFHPGDDGDCE